MIEERNPFGDCLTNSEKILWDSKPEKGAFITQRCLVMMPIALVWLCFDIPVIAATIISGDMGGMGFFLIPFFMLHLIPVWLWLGNCISASTVWK